MPVSEEQQQPTAKTGLELLTCPICYGHTKLLGGNVYCPNCAVIISENVTDSLKTKVELVREQVAEKQQAPLKRARIERGLVRSFFAGVFFAGFLIALGLITFTAFFYIQALAFEKAGHYKDAKSAYETSLVIFTIPGVKEAIVKNNRLIISDQEYRLGLAASKRKEWAEAIAHFEKVDEQDKNYALAQVEIEKARVGLMGQENKQ